MEFLGKTYPDGPRVMFKARPRQDQVKPFRVAANKQTWHGFTLHRGMIFGVYNGSYYVSTGEITRFRNDGVPYYQLSYECGTGDNYRWQPSSVAADTKLGRIIKSVAATRECVEYHPDDQRTIQAAMRPSGRNHSGVTIFR